MTGATTTPTDVASAPTPAIPVRVLGIAESPCAGSYNRTLLRGAREEAPAVLERPRPSTGVHGGSPERINPGIACCSRPPKFAENCVGWHHGWHHFVGP